METLFSPRMLAHYLAYICNCVPLGSLTFFTPTIVNGLGFSSIRAQLMTGKWCRFDILCSFDCTNTSTSATMGLWLLRLPFPRLECRPLQCSRLARHSELHDRRHRLAHSWPATCRRIHRTLWMSLPVCLRSVPKLRPIERVGDLQRAFHRHHGHCRCSEQQWCRRQSSHRTVDLETGGEIDWVPHG
jgi:hypothetical protein